MRTKLKLTLGEIGVSAKQAIVNPGNESDPRKWMCPSCHNPKAKRKALCDLVQYGFEWDYITTVMLCKCGQQFFSAYRNWHIQSE